MDNAAAEDALVRQRIEARGGDDEKNQGERNHAREVVRHHGHRDDEFFPGMIAHQQDDPRRVATETADGGEAEETVDHRQLDGAPPANNE